MNFDFHVRWYARMTEWVSEREMLDASEIKLKHSRIAHFHAEKASICLCSIGKNSIIKFIQCEKYAATHDKIIIECMWLQCGWVCEYVCEFDAFYFHAISIMSLNLQISSTVFVCEFYYSAFLCMDYKCEFAMDKLLCNSFCVIMTWWLRSVWAGGWVIENFHKFLEFEKWL